MKYKIMFFVLPILIVLIAIMSIFSYEYFSEKYNSDFEHNGEYNNESNLYLLNDESTSTDNADNLKAGKVFSISSYQELLDYTRTTDITIVVLSQTGCSYCEKFNPVLESISSEFGIEIAKINLKEITKEEYQNILNGEILMPAKCSKNGNDSSLSIGFGTPTTLFIKENKSFDCIRGYKNQENFETELKRLKLIK